MYQDDLMIAGHNYARHFSPLKWLRAGSEVNFTDAEGVVYHYEVAWLETLRPDEAELMTEPSDQWDLTLFTCTTGGMGRCAICCVRTEK